MSSILSYSLPTVSVSLITFLRVLVTNKKKTEGEYVEQLLTIAYMYYRKWELPSFNLMIYWVCSALPCTAFYCVVFFWAGSQNLSHATNKQEVFPAEQVVGICVHEGSHIERRVSVIHIVYALVNGSSQSGLCCERFTIATSHKEFTTCHLTGWEWQNYGCDSPPMLRM